MTDFAPYMGFSNKRQWRKHMARRKGDRQPRARLHRVWLAHSQRDSAPPGAFSEDKSQWLTRLRASVKSAARFFTTFGKTRNTVPREVAARKHGGARIG